MALFYRRIKTILMALLSIYLILSIYQISLKILQEENMRRFLDKVSEKPLCVAHHDVLTRLKRLTKDLIYVRMAVDRDVAIVKRIENHYNNLQKLTREIEFITSHGNTKQSTRIRLVEEDEKESDVVCPEVFRGSTFGYPFYRKGFETTNCSRTVLFKKHVTLIFDKLPVAMTTAEGETVASDASYLKYLSTFLDNIYQLYPGIKTYIVLDKSTELVNIAKAKHEKLGVNFVRAGGVPRGRIIREIIDQVNTQYSLIAPELTHFTSEISLERLIRVLSTHNLTHFAGGSSRNLSGHWSANCQQTQLKNYTLTHRSGYFRSFSECLVCDYLSGPFLAKTSTLKELGLDFNLDQGLYEDLFLRLKLQSSKFGRHDNAIVSCPDVMFNTHVHNTKDGDLLQFANKHSIRKIVEFDGKVRWYGCRRGVGHRIGDRCPVRDGFLVPPCCLENLADAIKFIMSQCDGNNIICELQEGTLLGALKFNKVLPWERDADITFLTADYDKLKDIKRVFEERGYVFRDVSSPWCCVEGRAAGGKIEILADGWSLQMYGQHIMDSETLINKGLRPTKVLFSGQWVNVPRNPGRHIRNRYGREIYRHAEHWMSTGSNSGWDKYDTHGFGSCPLQGFHGCIDQYLPDGSIQFENLF